MNALFTKRILYCLFAFVFILYQCTIAYAADPTIDLTVGYKKVHFAGKEKTAIAVNQQIPGPTLHFKEGDHVTINVHNTLDQETAIHWHGILLPWQMDGVLGVTQHGIPPGGTFRYQFTLHQSGTYWYHAHAGLQEQLGLYGAIVIDPPTPPACPDNDDYVIVLSDWSNTHPDQILANLKKDGDYYSPRFPLQPSLVKFMHDYHHASLHERKNLIADYKMMQQMRMGLYDLSDVAYDAFLLNGHTTHAPWTAHVNVGDTVRLRFIGAGGSTIFRVKIPGTMMQIVQIDGNNVKPYSVNDFMIAPGETYDALVTIENEQPYLIYAESIDTLGSVVGALITSEGQTINDSSISRFPEPLPVTRSMMSMPMHGHAMPMNSVKSPYENLQADTITNDPNKPIADVIHMELSGYMDRYIWFINGVPEYKAHPIILDPGKRYRVIFTNTSMMHHPMHIHGHWFILRNGHDAYDPLLHTINVPPGATITADIDTDASGQWLFHCHLLYHMMSGMSRVFQYSTLIDIIKDNAKPQDIIKNTAYINRPIVRVDEVRPIDPMLVKHPMAHRMGLDLSNRLEIGEDPFHNDQKLTFKGLYGHDYNKLELFTNDAEVYQGTVENADIDIFYWHLIDQFWALKGGANYFYRPAEKPYWQPGMGIEGLMPYFIDTDLRGYYYHGSAKLDAEFTRDTQITNNFIIQVGIRSILATKTIEQAAIGSGLNQMRYVLKPYYRLIPGLNIFAEYEYEHDYGAFSNIQKSEGDSATQNTLTFGLSVLF